VCWQKKKENLSFVDRESKFEHSTPIFFFNIIPKQKKNQRKKRKYFIESNPFPKYIHFLFFLSSWLVFLPILNKKQKKEKRKQEIIPCDCFFLCEKNYYFFSGFYRLSSMESTNSKRSRSTGDVGHIHPLSQMQVRDDTLAALKRQFPVGLRCEYYYDTGCFKVLDLGASRISNLWKLCELLACNSVRILRFDCICNSIRCVFAILTLIFFQVMKSVTKGPYVFLNLFDSLLHSNGSILQGIALVSKEPNDRRKNFFSTIWLNLFDLILHSECSMFRTIV
jgi:hypothetical protein